MTHTGQWRGDPNSLSDRLLVPVFYHSDIETAKRIVRACVDGGADLIEFTNRGDFAYQVFSELAKYVAHEHPHAVLGIGSVIDVATAALYVANGAEFVVGPVFNAELARFCNRRKVAYLPGCGSAWEIGQAEELGVEICKIFPGDSVGGPAFVKAILGPSPWTRIMPTGGVEATEESITAWFKAGVACVGIGSNLITKELVEAGDFEEITKKIRQVLRWINAARTQAVT